MPASHLHPGATVPTLTRLGRALAGAQALKETASIIFLGLPLVQASPMR